MSTSLPKQRVTLAEKKKKDFQWGKDTIKAYIDRANFNDKRKQDFYRFYDYYNGILVSQDYDYVSDPYKSEKRGTKRKFPAKIRNYNIIKPIIDLLLGEKFNRPFNYQVTVGNPDVKSQYEEYRTQQYMSYMEQAFVNQMNKQGAETGMPSKELPEPEEFAKQVETTYRDKRAILGQQTVDYIIDKVELRNKLQIAFLDWLITGEVYTYKGAIFDEVEYEVVSATDFIYEASPNTEYVEDGDMAGQRKVMSTNQVLDMFHDVLDEKDLEQLEHPNKHKDSFHIPFLLQNGSNNRESDVASDRWVEVIHLTWKAWARVGYVDTIENGVETTIEVDETYKPLPGEKIDWVWVNEAWEGYQIDGSIYKKIQAVDPQRNELSNVSKCKLSYNGKMYSNRNSENRGILEMLIPYQILFNVFHYRLELSIAKNKDKIALMEMNMIPKKHGWDEEKFMYFADAMGFAFIDSSAVGQNKERLSFNQFQVLDMSLGQYINTQFSLLQSIKQEAEELLGITRQRLGQVMASDGASNTNMSVGQSNVITSEIFRKFDAFEQRELQGLLDVGKSAYKDGLKKTYINSDYREVILDIGPDDIQESELNIFIKNSSAEDEKLKTMKSFAMQFAQNGSNPSTVSEILDSSNFAAIKEKVKEAEAAQQAYEEKLQKMQGDQAQQLQAMQEQAAENARLAEEAKQNKEIASKEKMHSEKMDVEWAKIEKDSRPQDDSIEWDKNAIKREELATKERIENKKIAVSKQKAKN